MKEKMDRIEGDISSIRSEIREIRPGIVKLLKEEYVQKLEFKPIKEKIDKVWAILFTFA